MKYGRATRKRRSGIPSDRLAQHLLLSEAVQCAANCFRETNICADQKPFLRHRTAQPIEGELQQGTAMHQRQELLGPA